MTTVSFWKSCLVAVFCLGLATSSFAQDQRFVMKLSNELVDSFKSFGSLKSLVPADARDTIGFVELQFEDTKDVDPIDLPLGLSVRNNEATIVLDDELINKVKGQPIRVSVGENEKGFGQVLLVYDAPTPASRIPIVKDAEGNAMEMVYVRLSDAKVMGGGIADLTKIELTTKFGPITVPMSQVAGVRFRIDDEDSAVVVMVNGDTVTGVSTMPDVELITDWGKAKIRTEFVQSITITPNSRFRKEDSDFGPRWVLDTGNSLAPGAPR